MRIILVLFVMDDSMVLADAHPAQLLINSMFNQVTARKFYPAAVAGLGFSFSIGKRFVTANLTKYCCSIKAISSIR